MRLKSRSVFPPNGFLFFQPQTDWSSSPGLTFDQTVDEIIRHRMANPRFMLPVDRASVEAELDEYTCLRIANNPHYVTGGAPVASSPFPQGPLPVRQSAVRRAAVAAAGVKEHVQRTAAGVRVLIEWLGAGLKPVSSEAAEARAQVCVKCPLNQEGGFWEKLDALAAEEVRTMLGIRHDLQMKTSVDAQLKSCTACGCWIALKVHVPLNHIIKQTPDDTWLKFDASCWLISEANKKAPL